jgi:hypothetical protein
MGVLAGDNAGFPNGRRPGDDVVDMALRVVMGALLSTNVAPSGKLPFTDGATVSASQFQNRFPYLTVPLPGSPNDPYITITPQVAGSVEGPYRSVPGTYESSTSTLTIAKPAVDASAGFVRVKSDKQVTLGNPVTTATEIRTTVR